MWAKTFKPKQFLHTDEISLVFSDPNSVTTHTDNNVPLFENSKEYVE